MRENTYVLTPENLVDQLRNSVREVAGLEARARLNPTEEERYSRMEAQLLDIIRIVEIRSAERFEVLTVINKEIIGWAAQWQAGTD